MPDLQHAVFSHPSVKNRLRFDLLSNGLGNLSFSIDQQRYPLGDMSVGGFCFLAPFGSGIFSGLTAPVIFGPPGDQLVGEQVRGTFQFAGTPQEDAVHLVGVIQNAQVIQLIGFQELVDNAQIWLEANPQWAELHSSQEKLVAIKEAYTSALDAQTDPLDTSLPSLNVSILNLLIEAGMPTTSQRDFLQGQNNLNHMLKIGVEFFTAVEGMELMEFTKPFFLYPPDQAS